MNSYWLYGLRLLSNEQLSCLRGAESGTPDVVVSFESVQPAHVTRRGLEGPRLQLHAATAGLTVRSDPSSLHYEFEYRDHTEFVVSAGGESVTALTPAGATLEDTLTYFVGPVAGFVLRLRGIVSLHASTVLIQNKAVCLCGGPGAGKSSAAAAMALRGYPIVTEDMAPLDDDAGAIFVRPGHARVNLWPESVSALFGSADALPPITPTWTKRYMPLGDAFWEERAPLAAVYILTDRHKGQNPLIQHRSAFERFVALAANTYVNYLLDPAMRAREFDVLTRLVRTVPVYFVSAPADLGCIGSFCDALVAHATKTLKCTA